MRMVIFVLLFMLPAVCFAGNQKKPVDNKWYEYDFFSAPGNKDIMAKTDSPCHLSASSPAYFIEGTSHEVDDILVGSDGTPLVVDASRYISGWFNVIRFVRGKDLCLSVYNDHKSGADRERILNKYR